MSKLSAEMAGEIPATGDDSPALVVSNMDVTYTVRDQDRLALRDVSFSIGRGESYGLVGESGSRQVHGGAGAGALPAPQRPGERRDDQHQRAGPAGHG